MKSRFSFTLCGVLIFCIISSLNVAAGENTETDSGSTSDSDEDFLECTAYYLKSKGKIEAELPSSKKSSMCVFGMQIALYALRSIFETKMNNEMPNEANCAMEEFDKNGIIDLVMHMTYIKTNSSMTEADQNAALAEMEKEGDEKVKSIATKCGIDEEKLNDFMDHSFDSSEETEAASKTVKEQLLNPTSS